jgi:lactate permease
VYRQIYDPVANSISASAACAAVPLVVLFVMLGVFRISARWSALGGLIAAAVVAVTVYAMPTAQVGSAALEGASIGFFPIIWIGINAIWVFKLTQVSGHDVVLRQSLAMVSQDLRVQAILIAFCFGGLLESVTGGGAPVAICAVMLISIGVDPIKAAAICLIADTSPVAFGSLGLPINLLGKVTELPVHTLSMMVGRQTLLLALIVPLILVVIADGRRGMREVWPLALVAGVTFATTQCFGSMFMPLELVGISSALVSIACSLGFLKVWAPTAIRRDVGYESATALPAGHVEGAPVAKVEVLRALSPYFTIIALVGLMQVDVIGKLVGTATSSFGWPGLDIVDAAGKPVSTTAKFEWLSSAGSITLFAGIIVGPILGLPWSRIARLYLQTLYDLRWAIFTVCCVVGCAYVMNLSGQVITLGIFAANAGPMFAFVSPILGWFATSLTGSDTSANALFGVLQITTAHRTGLSDILLAAANSSGGVAGKAISPQNLTIAAVAVGVSGKEGQLFRRVFGWTLLMITAMSILVYLQSTSVLGWTVP